MRLAVSAVNRHRERLRLEDKRDRAFRGDVVRYDALYEHVVKIHGECNDVQFHNGKMFPWKFIQSRSCESLSLVTNR